MPAGGGNTLVITYICTFELGTQGRVVIVAGVPVPAGSGGGPDRDGISGTDFSVVFLRDVLFKVLELEAPVLVRRFGLLPDSEGPGRYRGGFGLEYELEIRHPSAVVVMRGKDRHRFSSWGVAGGRAGAVNGNDSLLPDAPKRDIGKRTVYRPELHEVIRLWSGGGGGYGDPFTRDPVACGARCGRRVGVARAGEGRVWCRDRWRWIGLGRDHAVTKLSTHNRGF